MSGVSGIGGGSSALEMLKILEQGQEKSIDLVKKLVGMAASNKVTSAEAEGKGAALDLYA